MDSCLRRNDIGSLPCRRLGLIGETVLVRVRHPPVVRTYGTRKIEGHSFPPNELGGYYQIDPTGRKDPPVDTGGYIAPQRKVVG